MDYYDFDDHICFTEEKPTEDVGNGIIVYVCLDAEKAYLEYEEQKNKKRE